MEKFLSSEVAFRALVVLLVLGFAIALAGTAMIGWQAYQTGLAMDRAIHHLLMR